MTCTEVQERDIAEAYLLGRLDAAERDAFEAHYFECAQCYSHLQALRSVREALAGRAPARQSPWPWLAVAATILLAAGAGMAWYLQTRPGPNLPPAGTIVSTPDDQSRLQLARLAQVAPPPYEPRTFRSAGTRETFNAGMRLYTSRDYAGAVGLLERALKEEPAAEDARFYLGASLILQDRPADAVTVLGPLAGKTESAYAEEARFLIAKAHLRAGNLDAAAAALEETAKMHGDREGEASSLRARVVELRDRRPK